jgi:hypothetical protein
LVPDPPAAPTSPGSVPGSIVPVVMFNCCSSSSACREPAMPMPLVFTAAFSAGLPFP